MTGIETSNTVVGSPPWKLEARSSRGFVITVVAIAVFTDVFIYGMIIPILPTVLKTRVDISEDQLQKWMSALLAAFGGGVLLGSPIFGYFADKGSSRRLPFVLGLIALGGSTVMFWFARDGASLVIARVLQGLSGAAVWTVGLALVVDTVGKDRTGLAMSFVSVSTTVGLVSGPFLGGIILSKAGYHAVFVVAIGLIVLDVVLRMGMIEKKTASQWLQKHPDGETEGLLSGSFDDSRIQREVARDSSDQAAAERDSEPESDGEPTPSGRPGSVPGIARLLLSGNLLAVLMGALVNSTVTSSYDTVLPVYVLRTFHWGPFLIGLCFIPLFIPSFFAPVVGTVVDRYGARRVACLGFMLNMPVYILLQLVKHNSTAHQVLLYVFLFLAGVAGTLRDVSLMVVVTDVVEGLEKDWPGIFGEQGGTGQAYGLYNVAWSGGQVLGPLFAGYLVEARGWATLVTVFGVMSGVTAVVLGATGRESIWRRG